jgi:large subunit ribosomal protein L3
MPSTKSPRKGSLQFWPRKRINKFLPRVNWNAVNSDKKLKGFVGYKAGMVSVEVKDNTNNSMTKGKNIIIPGTVIECPKMKIFSVRFYKDGVVKKDVLGEQLDKELKKKVKVPKQSKTKLDSVKVEDYDDVSIIAYTVIKKTGLKKKPDLAEIGISGLSVEEKLNFVKENLNKEISVMDVFDSGQLIDLRGLTKGKGFSGPVKRFGIHLKSHKSEKGVRRPGNVGPWHPARVTFRVPMAGQLGKFTRVHYNGKVIVTGNDENIKSSLKAIKNYGDVKTDYIIVSGSVQGPAKRQIFLTSPLRKSKMSAKKNYEFGRVLR